jgi:hypothetical protein
MPLQSALPQSGIPRDSARTALLAKLADPDPFVTPAGELAELRLEAARETFDERRRQIPLLQRRADEAGVQDIRGLSDLVPLLFSHTTYKSYPTSFVSKGQWSRLLSWFGTLSALPVDQVDVDGVRDIDEFIQRLWAAGHVTITTSGTSGKVSFLHRTQADNDLYIAYMSRHYGWPGKVTPARNLHFFMLAPKFGPYMLMTATRMYLPLFARPDSQHWLTEKPLSVAFLIKAAEMRQRMGDGSATPEEIADFEARAKAQAEETAAAFERISDQIFALRAEPMMLISQWAMLWRLMQRARQLGIGNGEFSSGTIVSGGGGLKGLNLPSDYEAQVKQFLGPVLLRAAYGMSEMSVAFPRCEARRYHTVPWVVPLMLNATGEQLLDAGHGLVEGRFGFLDVSLVARWGGMITGDKITMDFAPTCPCGRPGPTVLPTVTRYSDLGEEDKIGCAGTLEAYIRGSLTT